MWSKYILCQPALPLAPTVNISQAIARFARTLSVSDMGNIWLPSIANIHYVNYVTSIWLSNIANLLFIGHLANIWLLNIANFQ